MSQAPLWTSSPQRAAQSNLGRFMAGHDGYDSLWRWSISQREEFWAAVWRFCGIRAGRLWDAVTEPLDDPRQVTWFPGARLNYAANLLRYQDQSPAIIAWGRDGRRRAITNLALHHRVSRLAQAMCAAGIGKGDCVAGCLPNVPEAVIALLAVTSIGAVWTACPSHGTVGDVVTQFREARPKMLISSHAETGEIVRGLPTLRRTVVVPTEGPQPVLSTIPHALHWQDEVAFYSHKTVACEPLEFDHPLYMSFGPGGRPYTHGTGGILLQHLKELVLHMDVRPTDRVYFQASCGDQDWYRMVSALGVGACVVLHDHEPHAPDPAVPWRIAAEERVNVMGMPAPPLQLSQPDQIESRTSHSRTALRTLVYSGGEPPRLDPGSGIQLVWQRGAAELLSNYEMSNPLSPMLPGAGGGRALGIECQREEGRLLCKPPLPAIPIRTAGGQDVTWSGGRLQLHDSSGAI